PLASSPVDGLALALVSAGAAPLCALVAPRPIARPACALASPESAPVSPVEDEDPISASPSPGIRAAPAALVPEAPPSAERETVDSPPEPSGAAAATWTLRSAPSRGQRR